MQIPTHHGLPASPALSRSCSNRGWQSRTVGENAERQRLAETCHELLVDPQAAVTRMKGFAGAPESLIVTVWSDEGSGGSISRLVAMELPRVD